MGPVGRAQRQSRAQRVTGVAQAPGLWPGSCPSQQGCLAELASLTCPRQPLSRTVAGMAPAASRCWTQAVGPRHGPGLMHMCGHWASGRGHGPGGGALACPLPDALSIY